MRVKLLCNLGTNDFPSTPYLAGEEPEVDETLGERLLKQGLAVKLEASPVEEPEVLPLKTEDEPAPKPAPLSRYRKKADSDE